MKVLTAVLLQQAEDCQGLTHLQGWGFVSSWQVDDPVLQFCFRVYFLGLLLAPTL